MREILYTAEQALEDRCRAEMALALEAQVERAYRDELELAELREFRAAVLATVARSRSITVPAGVQHPDSYRLGCLKETLAHLGRCAQRSLDERDWREAQDLDRWSVTAQAQGLPGDTDQE